MQWDLSPSALVSQVCHHRCVHCARQSGLGLCAYLTYEVCKDCFGPWRVCFPHEWLGSSLWNLVLPLWYLVEKFFSCILELLLYLRTYTWEQCFVNLGLHSHLLIYLCTLTGKHAYTHRTFNLTQHSIGSTLWSLSLSSFGEFNCRVLIARHGAMKRRRARSLRAMQRPRICIWK